MDFFPPPTNSLCKQPILQKRYLSTDFPAHLEGRASLYFHPFHFSPEHKPKGLQAAQTQPFRMQTLWEPAAAGLWPLSKTGNGWPRIPSDEAPTRAGLAQDRRPQQAPPTSAFPGPFITFTWSKEGKQSVSLLVV